MESTESKKGLGLFSLIMLATGQVIGAGVVTLVGTSIAFTGRSAWLAYAAAVVMGLCIILPYILLSSMLRVKGGNYTFVAAILGDKWGGMYGMAFTMLMFACGMFGLSLGNYLNSLFPAWNPKIVAIASVTVFYVFNMLGVDFMSKIQNVLSAILIIGLLIFTAVGAGQMRPGTFDFNAPDFFSNGASGFFIAVTLLVYSCTGQSFVVVFSKEARKPKRDVPYAILITTGIILVIYTSIAMVDTGILPIAEVAGKPLTVVAREIMPTTLYYCFVIGGPIMALSTTLNTSFSIFTRPVHQMTNDGWFPLWLGKTNKYGAPFYILTIMYAISIIPIALDLSISVITSNLVLIGRAADLVAIVAVILLPKYIPEAWDNRYFKRLTKPMFYGLMAFSLGMSLLCLYLSMGNISASNIYVAAGLALLFFTYATLRQKSGHVKMQKSYELQ